MTIPNSTCWLGLLFGGKTLYGLSCKLDLARILAVLDLQYGPSVAISRCTESGLNISNPGLGLGSTQLHVSIHDGVSVIEV